MRRRMLCAAVLAVALGAGCAKIDRRAAGVYANEPWVDMGIFTRVGGKEAWIFAPALGWRKDRLPVWVTPDTDVFRDGVDASLDDVQLGQTVRLVYDIRRDGTGVAERIDIIGPSAPHERPATGL